ncbi:methyltransferase domain-containing protein [Novosphingobium sp.]|uniref:methyltransferase domain-containing protein n=1 Tax=Novosphingobium sp. TaxID=1874826 RepID=UPI002639ACB5|nr:methyltransferase domain-containing protein [Novosphingobium sp.]
MDDRTTSYDRVHYPSAVYRTTTPEHLAAIARLHGLDAADPRSARVLEIAGGDGLNVLAMAAAYPGAQFVSFDLAASAVAHGQALIASAGLANVRIETTDILEAAGSMEGPFDYVIAHGLYAWVPPHVQQATLALIDRVLSPQGIVFISYNALPGGHLRMALRDMLLFELEGVNDPEARIDRAIEVLNAFGQPRDDDSVSQAALRRAARLTVGKDRHTLFHDELGPVYDPKALQTVAEEAAAHNLAYLTEAQPGGLFHGFPGEQVDDRETVRRAQRRDNDEVCFFHQSLFVRPERHPARVPDPAWLGTLLAGVPDSLRRTSESEFTSSAGSFQLDDPVLADFLEKLVRIAPARFPLADLAASEDHAAAILELINQGIIEPHSLPFPGALLPGERPVVSALVRALLAHEVPNLVTMDHRVVHLTDDAPRRLMALMDGTRTAAEIAADARRMGLSSEIDVNLGLQQLARVGMLALSPDS